MFVLLLLLLLLCLFYFETDSHCVALAVFLNIPSRANWPGTHRAPPVSSFQVVRLKICATVPSPHSILFKLFLKEIEELMKER